MLNGPALLPAPQARRSPRTARPLCFILFTRWSCWFDLHGISPQNHPCFSSSLSHHHRWELDFTMAVMRLPVSVLLLLTNPGSRISQNRLLKGIINEPHYEMPWLKAPDGLSATWVPACLSGCSSRASPPPPEPRGPGPGGF